MFLGASAWPLPWLSPTEATAVVATVRDSTDGAKTLRDALVATGANAEVMVLDVTEDAAVDAVVRAVLWDHGRIDVLVNNAGLGYRGTLEELSIGDFQASLEVNFLGAVRTMKAVLPSMRRAG